MPLESARQPSLLSTATRVSYPLVHQDVRTERAGQVARLAARERLGAAFSNPWPDFADRHDRPVQEAMTRLQPLILLAASLAATAALLMLLGAVGPALVTALDVGPAHAVAPGAE